MIFLETGVDGHSRDLTDSFFSSPRLIAYLFHIYLTSLWEMDVATFYWNYGLLHVAMKSCFNHFFFKLFKLPHSKRNFFSDSMTFGKFGTKIF